MTETTLFSVFATFTLLSALMVIRAKNPVYSVLFLILVFCNAAGLLVLLDLDFFAVVFLVVYVGAVAVLFLFVVMMLDITISEVNETFFAIFTHRCFYRVYFSHGSFSHVRK